MNNESKTTPEFIDFYAEWCGPCHVMKPIIEEVEKEYEGKITFTKVDVDQNPELSQQYNVLSIPTYIFKKDGTVKDQAVGTLSKDELKKKLDELLS